MIMPLSIAAAQHDIFLPIAAAARVEKTTARDAFLQARGVTGFVEQCRICGQELAAPFRKVGVHPPCLYSLGE
jgi:hypothetical protein